MFVELWNELLNTSFLELVAVISLVGYVILATRQSPWCWPVSIIGVILYTIQALKSQLYGEVPLQIYYIAISIYGWVIWRHGGPKDTPLKVSWLKRSSILGAIGIGLVGTVLYGFLLDHIVPVLQFFGVNNAATYVPPSLYPYFDAFTTTFSFIATYFQARKKIENWALWILIDGVYVYLWAVRGIVLFSGLSILYIALAAYGYWSWYQSYKSDQHAN